MLVDTITPRLQYMAAWLGQRLQGKPLPLVTTVAALPLQEPVINYSTQQLTQIQYQIQPDGLLYETGIADKAVPQGRWQNQAIIFPATAGDHPFDVLAAAFYCITRYEEYLPKYEPDEYGRYSHTNSVLFQLGWLKRPIVDEWLLQLTTALQERFPEWQPVPTKASTLLSFDVDLAWSYLHKGFWRNVGGAVKSLLRNDKTALQQRLAVLQHKAPDPFDVFAAIQQQHTAAHIPAQYFFLLAQTQKGYDKNISPNSTALQALMRQTATHSAVGLHASWAASLQASVLQQEQEVLQHILQMPNQSNRMHYINFRLPQTFRELLQVGILKEYSMGYGTINGFRAGTSVPYYWYDLEAECSTDLEIHPFGWMDANSIFEQKDTPADAAIELQLMQQRVQQSGGQMISIWHNHLLGLDALGRQWWPVYTTYLRNLSS
ncbi:MAG: hypothetical protein LCH58_00680 [Bacteroidetes bacterium]|uniref:DUF7033 domain-containing protein n=1 Tax=Phnomibacter sp. TaxID=2836217 RepID=UPI002FDD314A|nr:hypothetical protein [Bacteroidota bacterium]